MSQPTASRTSETQVTTSTSASPATRDRLATDDGQISVAEGVVQKIAGKACREIAGVHAMGTSGSRAFGTIRERIPGSSGPNVAQGVGVEVGDRDPRRVHACAVAARGPERAAAGVGDHLHAVARERVVGGGTHLGARGARKCRAVAGHRRVAAHAERLER